ncbi:ACP S-malonyltransferase, partial [uncultured Microbacterium sp.]|uniref:ACP S-malonyltransferase n=1 Tax=uncultured Microbacterium sp. TaxID=191216 RepID=UPI0025F0313F
MIVVVCPGQGSQTPGFLSPWLELDGVTETLASYSEASEVDLRQHGTVSDANTIRDTRIAQPLIVAASLIAAAALTARAGRRADGVAGHSVGEIAALVGSGVIDAETGMRLVGIRDLHHHAEPRSRAGLGLAARRGVGLLGGRVELDARGRERSRRDHAGADSASRPGQPGSVPAECLTELGETGV